MKILRQVSSVSVWQAAHCVLPRLRVARGLWERGVGLMFRPQVPPRCGAGFLFLKARDLHTFCMRFPLDVVWLDGAGGIVEIRRGVRPGRVVKGPRGAVHVFEVAAGTLPELAEGVLRFEPLADLGDGTGGLPNPDREGLQS